MSDIYLCRPRKSSGNFCKLWYTFYMSTVQFHVDESHPSAFMAHTYLLYHGNPQKLEESEVTKLMDDFEGAFHCASFKVGPFEVARATWEPGGTKVVYKWIGCGTLRASHAA